MSRYGIIPHIYKWALSDMAKMFVHSIRRISDEDWEQARRSLLSYFCCHRAVSPDDMAQETLTRVLEWLERGNNIDGDSGFQKLCYGFARNLQRESNDKRKQSEPLDFDVPAGANTTLGLNSRESGILLNELLAQLSPADRELLLAIEVMNPAILALRLGTSVPRLNVKVFRVRRRVRKLMECQQARTPKVTFD
jgi:DNA-directed RNA polymerase specialized sigma24 family protein